MNDNNDRDVLDRLRKQLKEQTDRAERSEAEKALEPEEIAHGSISGVLEKIDLHDRNVFAIFPPIGGNQVDCYFDDELTPKVQVALRRTVTVYGKMHYVTNRISPLKVIVEDMEVHTEVKDIPSFRSLAGRLADVSEDSVSLIRKMLDEWDEEWK